MKKMKIWINGLTLLQQFIGVGILTTFVFSIFFSTFFSRNVSSFVETQMLSYLKRYENQLISTNRLSQSFISDINVDTFIYSLDTGEYLNTSKILNYGDFLKDFDPAEGEMSGVVFIGDREYIYSTRYSDNRKFAAVSFITEKYRSEYSDSVYTAVINFSFMMIGILFIFFLIWLYSIIKPLNQIRNYINQIRLGEKKELSINRSDEIGEVAEALVTMNRELTKAQKTKEEVIQNISHDLKTPIATIKSYSESIKDGIYPYDTLEKSVDVIIENASRLEKKVYNLNTFNRLEYLKDSPEESNMAKVIETAILSINAIRPEITIETQIDNTVEFHGANDAWLTVVENLLDNALRYAKTTVKIILEDSILQIYNDGSQMTQERIDKLFKPYEKGTHGNFGLGLSIVKKICETYGYNVLGENMDDGVVFIIYTQVKRKRQKKTKKDK